MAISVKMVASELLMCGLRNLPFVGSAVEVVQGVRQRHELLASADRLTATEERLTRIERGVRDLVEKEIRTTLENLSRPNIAGPSLNQEVRNLQEIRRQGWEPTLFEGLLRNSSHWQELRRNPQNYGRILSDRDAVTWEGIHVLITAESTRVLELTPFAFSQLLGGQSVGTPKAEVVAAEDIWALPAGVSPFTDALLDRVHGQLASSRQSAASHGSDSTSWKDWPPTRDVIAIRARYKDRLWGETDVAKLRDLLVEYWSQEQSAWKAGGKEPWNTAAKDAFLRDVARA